MLKEKNRIILFVSERNITLIQVRKLESFRVKKKERKLFCFILGSIGKMESKYSLNIIRRL